MYTDQLYKPSLKQRISQKYKQKISNYLATNTKRRLIFAITILVLLLLLLALLISSSLLSNKQSTSAPNEPVTQIKPAEKTKMLNKDFNFSIKNDSGVEITKIKYTIESAELREEIIIKGQKASAIEGRVFLILNLKLVNDSPNKIIMLSRDYTRLSVNGNDKELLAPDIHNDPVEIQAISTKETRLGFPINRSDKKLKLRIGEIKGDKANIDLNF